jgi:biofilm PGA synthesis N-glycosyltransferase PgaC
MYRFKINTNHNIEKSHPLNSAPILENDRISLSKINRKTNSYSFDYYLYNEMLVFKIIFWLSLAAILYTYLLYGILLWLYLKVFKRPIQEQYDDDFIPSVSILVACYNEEQFIQAKIENLLAIEYPKDKLEIAFVTDGSNDNTVSLINEAIDNGKGIKLFHEPERKGKQHAVNRVIKELIGDIIIFNDCNTWINLDAVHYMVRHFSDPKVGVVSGEKKIKVLKKDIAVSSGEGLYWKYESWLKSLDSDFHSTIGSAGELYAIRKQLYKAVPQNISIEDFYLSMQIASDGFINIYEPNAFAEEESSLDLSEELKRKRRIAVGAFNTVFTMKSVYQFSNIKLLFLYFSHRILRWLFAPLCLILIFLSSYFLVGLFYDIIFLAQLLFYSLAFIGWLTSGIRTKASVFYIPFYFCFMNTALLMGLYDFISGKNHVVWEKARRRP